MQGLAEQVGRIQDAPVGENERVKRRVETRELFGLHGKLALSRD